MLLNNQRKSYTILDTLLTLAIIGVVAVFIIPTLTKKWQEVHTVAAVKEAYSILDNAFKQAISNYGLVKDWSWTSSEMWKHEINGNFLGERLSKYMKVEEYCGTKKGRCFIANKGTWIYYKNLNGESSGIATDGQNLTGGRTLLKNGITIAYKCSYPKGAKYYFGNLTDANADNFIGEILVDINGIKGPNRFGYDIFFFGYGSNGLLLRPKFTNSNYTGVFNLGYCSFTNKFNKNDNGIACATWILLKGNTDYKYREISW